MDTTPDIGTYREDESRDEHPWALPAPSDADTCVQPTPIFDQAGPPQYAVQTPAPITVGPPLWRANPAPEPEPAPEEVTADLVYTTKRKAVEADDEQARTLTMNVDGQIIYIVRPRQLEEVMIGLAEAGARKATLADVLYAGREFLQTVIRPDSMDLLNRRIRDDSDPFSTDDLYEIMSMIVKRLNAA